KHQLAGVRDAVRDPRRDDDSARAVPPRARGVSIPLERVHPAPQRARQPEWPRLRERVGPLDARRAWPGQDQGRALARRLSVAETRKRRQVDLALPVLALLVGRRLWDELQASAG